MKKKIWQDNLTVPNRTGQFMTKQPYTVGLEDCVRVFMNFSLINLVEKSRSHRACRPGLQRAKFLKERGRDWNEVWNLGGGGRDLAGQNS